MSVAIAYPKLSITGDIGSGKSAVSKILQAETGYPIYSTGGLQRRIAARYGMTTLELNEYAETHPEIDDEIDGESIRLGMSDEARASIDHYIETHPRGRHGKVVYDLEGDFGITRDAMYEVFANYMKAFPVQRETPNA